MQLGGGQSLLLASAQRRRAPLFHRQKLTHSIGRIRSLSGDKLLKFVGAQRLVGAQPATINRQLTTVQLLYRFCIGRELDAGRGVLRHSPTTAAAAETDARNAALSCDQRTTPTCSEVLLFYSDTPIGDGCPQPPYRWNALPVGGGNATQ